MHLICGLGNPGNSYINNRHNIGYKFIDYLKDQYGFNQNFKSSNNSHIIKTNINNQETLLIKPLNFMNLSGQSVQAVKSYFKIENDKIIIIHDELDLPFGKIKFNYDGGNAGHNGLKDISNKIGNDYHRLRIGIDHPRNLNLKIDVSNYVLADFNNNEKKELNNIFIKAEEIIKNFI